MTETKRPTTIAEQIAILKDHGCIISDSTFAEEILSTINYYRLSAYSPPLEMMTEIFFRTQPLKRFIAFTSLIESCVRFFSVR